MKFPVDKFARIGLAAIPITAGSLAIYNHFVKSEYQTIFEFILIVLILAGFGAFNAYLFWQKARKRNAIITLAIHNFNHLMRDEIYKLRSNEKRNIKLKQNFLVETLHHVCSKSVNILSEAMSELAGDHVCVQIKFFPRIGKSRKISGNTKLKTLCVCKNAETKRSRITECKINESTCYEIIFLNREEDDFCSADFRGEINSLNKDGQKRFKVAEPNWQEFYGSVICVPIRLMKNRMKNPDNLGVILCDSKKKNAFKKSEIELLKNLIKAFADGLYTYMDRNLFLQKRNQTNDGKNN